MYKPKEKNITKLKAYLDKKDEKSNTGKPRCARTQ
tara:strand:+ start:6018 stop:6122 length:105 start_codon:yes stop_codon:yes gene_type:complete